MLSGCGNYPWEDYYFDRLCERESGIRIFRTVTGVESVLQMQLPESLRKQSKPPLYVQRAWAGHKPYWRFDSGMWTNWYPKNFLALQGRYYSFEDQENIPVTKYAFFEGVVPHEVNEPRRYVRLTSRFVLKEPCKTQYCYHESQIFETKTEVTEPQSKYGFKWEDIYPEWFADRIGGMRFTVVDLQTGEILATAQDFMLFSRGVSSKFGGPRICMKPDGSYDMPSMHEFVLSVLRPIDIGPRERIYKVGTLAAPSNNTAESDARKSSARGSP